MCANNRERPLKQARHKRRITMSNILAVFNPPPQRELKKEETMDCVPCQVMSTMFSVGFGSYLASGKPFKYGKKDAKEGPFLWPSLRRETHNGGS